MKLQELKENLNCLFDSTDCREKILEISKFAKGYKETWLRLLSELKKMKDKDLDPRKREALEKTIPYAESIIQDARVKIMRLGITIPHPFDRAFEYAFQLNINGYCNTQEFLQHVYDKSPTAVETIRKIIEILEQQTDDPEAIFYADQLKSIRRTDAAKRLSHRGVILKDPLEAQKNTFINRQMAPHKARAKALREYAELSRMEREYFRMEQAKKKNWLYAGRRQDLKDINDHHPFFSSIYAANYARMLDQLRVKWIYSANAFFIKVPKEERRINQKSLMIEPEFYLPNENRYLILIPDRRFVNNGCHQSSLPERTSRAEVAQELLMEKGINMDIIYPEDLTLAEELENAETLPRSRYALIGREKTEGNNIQNNPEKFLLEKCDCISCNQ